MKAIAIKAYVWSKLSKVILLSNGENRAVIIRPIAPNANAHRRTIIIMLFLELSDEAAISRTALSLIPKLKTIESSSIAELYIPKSPTPAAPIHTAISFVRTIEKIILIDCTPPKIPRALSAPAVRLLFVSDAILFVI